MFICHFTDWTQSLKVLRNTSSLQLHEVILRTVHTFAFLTCSQFTDINQSLTVLLKWIVPLILIGQFQCEKL